MDVGCGSGVLGLMALRAGAKKVYFIDDGAVLEVARRVVREAGFSAQAEFVRSNSFAASLPERVDVVVCDHVGYFGFDYGILSLLEDARRRFLKPNGIILPESIDLLLAPVESEACAKLVNQWRDGSVPGEFSWLAASAANTKHRVTLEARNLIAGGAKLGALQLNANQEPYLAWDAEIVCTRDAVLHGFAGWFDCCLYGDIRMSNSPAEKDRLDRPQAFFPLENAVPVTDGDAIRVSVMARHLDGIIGWIIEVRGEKFSYNTFNSQFLDRETILRSQLDQIATLNQYGKARQVILSYCDNERSVSDIQAIVKKEHPDLLPSEHAISTYILKVLSSDTGS